MADEKDIPKSLVEQICDEFVEKLENKEGFDADLIKNIKELSRAGELKSPTKVQSILKPKGGAL